MAQKTASRIVTGVVATTTAIASTITLAQADDTQTQADDGKIRPNIQSIENYDVRTGPLKPDGTPMFDPIPTHEDFFNKGGAGEKFIPGMINLFRAWGEGFIKGSQISLPKLDLDAQPSVNQTIINDKGYASNVADYITSKCTTDTRICIGSFNDVAYRIAADFSTHMKDETLKLTETNSNQDKVKNFTATQIVLLELCENDIKSLQEKTFPSFQALSDASTKVTATCIHAYKYATHITKITFQPEAMNTLANTLNCYNGKPECVKTSGTVPQYVPKQ